MSNEVATMKAKAYRTSNVIITNAESKRVPGMIVEFGYSKVFQWYVNAAKAGCDQRDSIQYLYGCANNTRRESDYKFWTIEEDQVCVVMLVLDEHSAVNCIKHLANNNIQSKAVWCNKSEIQSIFDRSEPEKKKCGWEK